MNMTSNRRTKEVSTDRGTISYAYDPNSNIRSININAHETTYDKAYDYDKLDRLTGDTVAEAGPVNYAYDLNDNRLTRQQGIDSIDEILAYIDNSNRIQITDPLQTFHYSWKIIMLVV